MGAPVSCVCAVTMFSSDGFDAFGLPAENAAIKRGIHPKVWTYANIERMRAQLKTMGAMFDWRREAISSDPKYYRWSQWFFLQLYKHDLAYRKMSPVTGARTVTPLWRVSRSGAMTGIASAAVLPLSKKTLNSGSFEPQTTPINCWNSRSWTGPKGCGPCRLIGSVARKAHRLSSEPSRTMHLRFSRPGQIHCGSHLHGPCSRAPAGY